MTYSIVNFHAHLDACKQCRERPFNLCLTGTRLLKKAADKAAEMRPPKERN